MLSYPSKHIIQGTVNFTLNVSEWAQKNEKGCSIMHNDSTLVWKQNKNLYKFISSTSLHEEAEKFLDSHQAIFDVLCIN